MKQKTVKTIAIILVLAMVVTSFSFVIFLPSVFGATDQEKKTERLELLSAYIDFIVENYKDEIDYDTIIDGAFNGATESLNDEYSIYYSEDEDAQYFAETVDGTFYGVGVQIRNEAAGVTVISPVKGTPADRAGVKSGDIIIKVDQIDTTELSSNEVANLLRGKEGTSVTMTVNRDGNVISFNLVREKVSESCVEYQVLEDNIGYIALHSFDSDAEYEFAYALYVLKEQGIKSLIVDLRNNSGGYISKAEEIADYLLEDCDITHYYCKDEIIKTISADDGEKVDIPIVAIVNEGTASAAELLAAAIGDNGGKLVGTKTYGKGIAQSMMTLVDGKKFKLSVYYFLTPKKENFNEKGIVPDIYVQNSVGNEEVLKGLQQKYSTFAPMSEKVKPTIGSVGLNVYAAQQRLEFLGYDVKVTGEMDEKTTSAVKSFQSAMGLFPYPVLDYTTMNKLEQEAYEMAYGYTDEDLQLKKAIESLAKF